MLQIKKYAIIFILLIVIMGVGSCGLFKGKNKCGDCPTWSQNKVPDTNQKAINV